MPALAGRRQLIKGVLTMRVIRMVSRIREKGCLASFGNPSWSGTPFGSSSDTCIPSVTSDRPGIKKEKKDVSFEINDPFTLI